MYVAGDIQVATTIIHETPNRSATMPNRGEKKVGPIGICTWPPSETRRPAPLILAPCSARFATFSTQRQILDASAPETAGKFHIFVIFNRHSIC